MSDVSEQYDELIRTFPLFAGLTKHGARLLRERGTVRELDEGEPVFAEGDAPRSVLLVLRGTLEIFVVREEREFHLNDSGSGAFVGELGVLCGLYRSASVRAKERSVVLEWTAAEFRSMLLEDLSLSQRIFKSLLRTLIEKERVLIDSLSGGGAG